MKHISILVRGGVQGVFYRASAKKEAAKLRIAGFVRNESNGDVYIEAEGAEAYLEQFVLWCKIGPPKAVVEEIKVEEGELRDFDKFEIR